MLKLNRDPSRTVLPLRAVVPGVLAFVGWFGVSVAAFAAEPRQMVFATPEEAADALVTATQADKTADIERIFGASGHKLIYSGDSVADKLGREKFVTAYSQKHVMEPQSDDRVILIVSTDEWPFPIPLVKQGNGWRFDTQAGVNEILNRRVGRNELNAIQVCAAIVDAEHDYASKDRTGSGFLEYAQKFMSSNGKHDGLYWPAVADEESPIGPLVVSARAEGYVSKAANEKRSPYHGYFYKILTQQGKDAPGGAHGYIVNGHMIGGFAVIAFPAKYDDSGVMTFMVDQDGVLYEKNLGPNSTAIAQAMTAFNPDDSWKKH